MKTIAEYSKGRPSAVLFSMLSSVAFFSGAVVSIYAAVTDRDEVLAELFTFNFRGDFDLTGLLGSLLFGGFFLFLMALLADFIVKIRSLSRDNSTAKQHVISYLLYLIIPGGEDKENIVGDLLEEYSTRSPTVKAYLWLFVQAIRSVPPLALKAVRNYLASWYRKWTR